MSDLFGLQGLSNSQHSNSSQQQIYANQTMAQNQMQAMMNNAAYLNGQFSRIGGMAVTNPFMAYRPMAPVPSVSSSAASRVDRADWEKEADRKGAELDEWLTSIGMDHIADGGSNE